MSADAKSRKLVLLTHEFDPKRGGIATFCEEIALAAHAAGHAVEVWTHRDREGVGREWPFPVRRLAMRGSHGLRCQMVTASALFSERKRLHDATVLLAEPGPMLAALWLLPFRDALPRRLALTFHGSEILRFHHNPIVRPLMRALVRRAFRISTLTGYTRDLLCRHFPEAADKTVLTPGAVRGGTTPISSTGNASSSDAGRLVVLTVGRLHPRKGQLQTLRALDALPAQLRERVEYWIVGKAGDRHHEDLLQIAAANAAVRVRFLGGLSDAQLDLVYRRADVFALTSVEHGHSVEGFGLVYLDAAARGLPVVAHRIGGVPEAVSDGETGLLVAPDRPAELTAAFEKLLTDAGLRRRIAAAGPAWALKNSWRESAERLLEEESS
jgi:phosphatidylinositol alpha-1,6-mannosyltransferase